MSRESRERPSPGGPPIAEQSVRRRLAKAAFSVVSDSEEFDVEPAIVEDRERSAVVSVPWLPHAAGVDEVVTVVERHASGNALRRERARVIVVVAVDARDVSVTEETDPRRRIAEPEHREARGDARRRGQVVAIVRCRVERRVNDAYALVEASEDAELAQPLAVLGQEGAARPENGVSRDASELVRLERTDGGPIVVARDRQRSGAREKVDALVRVRVVTDRVTERNHPVHGVTVELVQHRGERFEVRVHVRDDREPHDAPSSRRPSAFA